MNSMKDKCAGRYHKPVVTAIKLDPNQAIIAVCEAAGAYFSVANGKCFVAGGVPISCTNTVRGSRGHLSFTSIAVSPGS